ncbi:hypothetical protein INR49_030433 [Caranx melampygus]|nr:hypothetical protein INR49_030433 [Caranx melampygus]
MTTRCDIPKKKTSPESLLRAERRSLILLTSFPFYNPSLFLADFSFYLTSHIQKVHGSCVSVWCPDAKGGGEILQTHLEMREAGESERWERSSRWPERRQSFSFFPDSIRAPWVIASRADASAGRPARHRREGSEAEVKQQPQQGYKPGNVMLRLVKCEVDKK